MQKSLSLGLASALLLAGPALSDTPREGIDAVTVQAVPWNVQSDGLSQNISILDSTQLDNRLESTLGETLSGLPGVSSTFFGPGASRPIIRGQSGDRVRILVVGIGTFDASSVSPDHAIAGESLSIERIELIRGPSTLLYGPNAIGGVVNILDGRIPTEMPEKDFKGAIRSSYGTNADERTLAGSTTFAASNKVAIHMDGFYRRAGDYRVPRSAHEEGEKRVENSRTEGWAGTFGLSWVGERAFFGASVSVNSSKYGIPGEHHHHGHDDHDDHDDHDSDHDEHEGEEEGEDISIDLDQIRVDVMAGLNADFLIFEQVKFRFGWADYDHVELEGDEIGTLFRNEGWEGRLDFVQQDLGGWTGAMGISAKRRDFAAIGEEAFTPPSITEQWGIFIAEEAELGAINLQLGLRHDQTRTKNLATQERQKFSQFSASIGAIWSASNSTDILLNLSRTERAPTAEELYSNGAHLATQTFELGDSTLGEETAWSAELGLRLDTGQFSLEAFAYYTRYEDYIYQQDLGLEEDELPVLQYAAGDASFHGVEVDLRYDFGGGWSAHTQLNAIRAKLRNGGGNLPRIPPLSATIGVDYDGPRFQAGVDVSITDHQNRIAAFEDRTPGHVFANAYVAWQPFGNRPDLSLRLQGKNLFNNAGFNHSSFTKFEAPLPGRKIKFLVVGRF
jgi:iron complex outermembrane receptor protein